MKNKIKSFLETSRLRFQHSDPAFNHVGSASMSRSLIILSAVVALGSPGVEVA
jgi:hypothetical protein